MIAMLRRSERTVVPVSMVLDMSSPGAPGHRTLAPGTKRRGSHGRAIVGFYYVNEVYQSGGPAALAPLAVALLCRPLGVCGLPPTSGRVRRQLDPSSMTGGCRATTARPR